MTTSPSHLKARKKPVQARSLATLAVLHTATIQVLGREGLGRCTTTRIADRAGISVGSLYQYYPNRDAILAAVLDHHLNEVIQVVQDVCRSHCGMLVKELAAPLVSSFLAVKFSDLEASRALYTIAGERGGPEKVMDVQARMTDAITAMLREAPDGRLDNPSLTAAVALNAMVGPVRAVLDGHLSFDMVPKLENELSRLIGNYFEASRALSC